MTECRWNPPCKDPDPYVCWALNYPGFFYTDAMLKDGPVPCPCRCHDDAEESDKPLEEIAA